MTDAVDVEATNDNSATTATTTSIQLDTTTPGQHTILYIVTDPKGLTGTAACTVIVSALEAANDNQASSTPAVANDNPPPLEATVKQ